MGSGEWSVVSGLATFQTNAKSVKRETANVKGFPNDEPNI